MKYLCILTCFLSSLVYATCMIPTGEYICSTDGADKSFKYLVRTERYAYLNQTRILLQNENREPDYEAEVFYFDDSGQSVNKANGSIVNNQQILDYVRRQFGKRKTKRLSSEMLETVIELLGISRVKAVCQDGVMRMDEVRARRNGLFNYSHVIKNTSDGFTWVETEAEYQTTYTKTCKRL